MFKALRFFPICIVKGFLFPVLAVSAIVATVVYVASKRTEKDTEIAK